MFLSYKWKLKHQQCNDNKEESNQSEVLVRKDVIEMPRVDLLVLDRRERRKTRQK